VAQLEWEWVHGWTVELVGFLLGDAEHGAHNRQVLDGWLAEWSPLAGETAQALEAVFDDLPAGISYEDARANVKIDVDEMLADCGLAPAAVGDGGAS
jgi:propane monooxygenase small subunit